MADLARILLYGDIHLSSKNYGAHVDYPKESLHYFNVITQKAEELQVTHIIGTGDLTYGRFHTLEYRAAVEKELEKQYNITKGNRYEVKGNHDEATYGMTEYEYYVKKGIIKPSTNLKIGNVNISMVDYGKHFDGGRLQPESKDEINVIVAHGFFKFNNSMLPDYGSAVELDTFTDWCGVDYLISGHIHNIQMLEGLVVRDGYGHRMVVHYIGAMTRPSYREGHMDTFGNIVVLTIRDNGEMKYDIHEVPLWDLSKSFNLDEKAIEKEDKLEKKQRLDISDIVHGLHNHKRNVGNPEDIIASMQGIEDKYKKKAIELLKAGLA